MSHVRVDIGVGNIAVNMCLVRHLDSQFVYCLCITSNDCFASVVYPICVNSASVRATMVSASLACGCEVCT